jgi:hypothetical protein
MAPPRPESIPPGSGAAWRTASVLLGATAKASVSMLALVLHGLGDGGTALGHFSWNYALISAAIALTVFGPGQLITRDPDGLGSQERLFVSVAAMLAATLVALGLAAAACLVFPTDIALVCAAAVCGAAAQIAGTITMRLRRFRLSAIAAAASIAAMAAVVWLDGVRTPLLVVIAGSAAQGLILPCLLRLDREALCGAWRRGSALLSQHRTLLANAALSNPLFVAGDLALNAVVAVLAPAPALALGIIGLLRQATNACLLIPGSYIQTALPELLATSDGAVRINATRRNALRWAGTLAFGSALLLAVACFVAAKLFPHHVPDVPLTILAAAAATALVQTALTIHGQFQLHHLRMPRLLALIGLRGVLLCASAALATQVLFPDLMPLVILLALGLFLLVMRRETLVIVRALPVAVPA